MCVLYDKFNNVRIAILKDLLILSNSGVSNFRNKDPYND